MMVQHGAPVVELTCLTFTEIDVPPHLVADAESSSSHDARVGDRQALTSPRMRWEWAYVWGQRVLRPVDFRPPGLTLRRIFGRHAIHINPGQVGPPSADLEQGWKPVTRRQGWLRTIHTLGYGLPTRVPATHFNEVEDHRRHTLSSVGSGRRADMAGGFPKRVPATHFNEVEDLG